MSRRAQAYTAVGPAPGQAIAPVGVAPTLNTRRRYGTDAFIGLITRGSKRAFSAIQQPWSGQGATFPAFPFVTGSSVAPNSIRPAILIALNYFSPSSHRNAIETVVPPQAVSPLVMRRPPQTQSGRPSGVYTIPSPILTTYWPTSSQWVANRMRTGQQPPSGWASQRIPSQ